MKQKKEKASELVPLKCVRCKAISGPTSDFCASCGMAFDLETAVDVEKEPEIAKILRESV